MAKALTMLVDSSSLIYRAFFAVPDTVRAPDGTPVNGAYGFLNMLSRLISQHRPTQLACALDADWRPEWRVTLLDSYKAHRVAVEPNADEDAIEGQIELVVELLDLMGIATIGVPDYEAEDVIGTIALRTTGRIAIVSGDRDLFQLVRDPNVVVLYPVRGVTDLTVVDEKEISRRYGIPGRSYADFAILRGDPSDGLPGVRGVGAKTAASLVSTHGTLEEILEAAHRTPAGPLAKIAASADYLERAARVVRITGDAPVADIDITLPTHPPKVRKVKELAERYALAGATTRLLAAISGPR
jgi:5'-3' exonuclease